MFKQVNPDIFENTWARRKGATLFFTKWTSSVLSQRFHVEILYSIDSSYLGLSSPCLLIRDSLLTCETFHAQDLFPKIDVTEIIVE